ncbi:ABC transporter ATP-binding protein [Synechococcus elongatus]|uniref:ABC transporter ATP-binding protein n=1 Tax=Synechococcus elongatus PCC 11801 TaxID=2219813 RepID=A0AAN1UTR1_SYNEL|nr:ABC transporter ATP-binding protein [Synechococcus elongatus]AZB71778.1 ABC transporter ATP-binding protein [Synechococcus elongatus PCC 11801]
MIEVEQLTQQYGARTAIQDLTFRVEAGEILGFLGPNGAGKTTTLRILAAAQPASRGTARIAGWDVHQQAQAVRKQIGYLPEIPPLYPEMTVQAYLSFVARLKGVVAGDRPQRLITTLQRCGLSDRARTPIRKLSKGYRQRVGLAQAIVHDPPVILLDEPTVGLDPRQLQEVRSLIRSLAGEKTVIFSSHILSEVSQVSDRVVILDQGRLVTTMATQDLLDPGGWHYRLEVSSDRDPLAVLQHLAGVQSVQVQAQIGDRWVLSLASQPDQELGASLAQTLQQQGFQLWELRRDRPSLEDIFLRLTAPAQRNQPEEPAE